MVGVWRWTRSADLHFCTPLAPQRGRNRCRTHRDAIRRASGSYSARGKSVSFRGAYQLHRHWVHHACRPEGDGGAFVLGADGHSHRCARAGHGSEDVLGAGVAGVCAAVRGALGTVGRGSYRFCAVRAGTGRRYFGRLVCHSKSRSRWPAGTRHTGAGRHRFRCAGFRSV